jgi:DNA-directed RNA polymerase beta subunit
MKTPIENGIYDYDAYLKGIEEAIKDANNIETDKRKLVVKEVKFGKLNANPESWADMKHAIMSKKTIGIPIRAKMELIDKETGNRISTQTVKMGTAPIMTKLNSYIVDGNQYNIPTQLRLKHGAYPRRDEKGEVEIFNNVEGGVPFRTVIGADKGDIKLKIRQGTVPLYPILKILGESDIDIQDAIGKELYAINSNESENDIKRIYKAITKKEAPANIDEAKSIIAQYFDKLRVDPDVTKTTLNKPYDKVDGKYLLDGVKKATEMIKNKESGENRNELAFKRAIGVDRMMNETITGYGKSWEYQGKAKSKMDKLDDISSILDTRKMGNKIKGVFTTSSISRLASQSNPIVIENMPYLTTLLGEGGISSQVSVPDDAKILQNSHMGFIDPNHTPESHMAGVTLTLSQDTKKDKEQIKTKVINLHTGKVEYKSTEELYNEPLAFPNEYKEVGGKYKPKEKMVHAIVNDKVEIEHGSDIKYMLYSPQGMFDIASNTIPFLQSNQGSRGMTSAKMSEQAISLDEPEIPYVQVTDHGISILEDIGSKYCTKAAISGEVTGIDDDYITIKGISGEKRKHELFNNIPLNDDSVLESRVKVAIGDRVKKGQIIADSNFTKDGILSTGVNLRTAYAPWHGWNFEDGIVITEDAAKKLRSVHMHKITIPKSEYGVHDLKKYTAYNPMKINNNDLRRYDPDGTIKPGQEVKPGDIMSAEMSKNILTGSDMLLSKLKKSAVNPYRDTSRTWDYDVAGIVTDKVHNKDGTDIYIKTKEDFKVGDKIVARHGNKGIVTKIIPRDLAPVTESGEKIDVILDPQGVVPRINMGQIIENAAGKLAEKVNKTYDVENFSGRDYRQEISDEMKRLGIKDKETITDPETGINIPNISTGNMYFMKLKHQVDKKISKRGISGGYTHNEQPTQGGGAGGQSIDKLTMNALLAYNARPLMKEMFSIKNNRNSDYWRAVQHGELPPAPQDSFELNKFKGLLQMMGVNTASKGTSIKLTPLTDRQIEEMSFGVIKDPTKTFKGKGSELVPDKDGLFGEAAGGMRGERFNHMDLEEEVVSPAYKDTIKTLLHLKDKEYNDML